MRLYFATIPIMLSVVLSGCGGGASKTSSPPPPAIHNEWAWINGLNADNHAVGIYGTQGVTLPTNLPGGRVSAASWTDANGSFWLFGGLGFDSAGNLDRLNDLWKYSNGQWTWMGGSNLVRQPGVYGTQGTASPGNFPGAHAYAVSLVDSAGNVWLLGGDGMASSGTGGLLNDLWKFSNGQWTWVSGSDVGAEPGVNGAWQGTGVYGTKGVADATNVPGARSGASGWADSSGNLWLFGGEGVDSMGKLGPLNDLWKYSNGEWTWMAGSNLANQFGTYGTQSAGAPGNTPGGRTGASTWTDSQGNLWLFGGLGADDATVGKCNLLPEPCLLNDLWKYSNGQWTWVGGSNIIDAPGNYGTQGLAATNNWPPPRTSAVAWTDSSGNFWLFGGNFVDDFNDLWKYSGGEWTWVSGSNQQCQAGTYGTEGTPLSGNAPDARDGSVGWIDLSGNLWLFGGASSCPGDNTAWKYNDLWEYRP